MNCHFITTRPYRDKTHKEDLDRYEDFLYFAKNGRLDGWSANKNFQPGDLVFFYFALPLMTIEAVALVDTEPYIDERGKAADISNPIFCDFAPVLILQKEVHIKELTAANPLLATWWKSKPYRSIRMIDPAVALALLEGISTNNPKVNKALAPLVEEISRQVESPPEEPLAVQHTPIASASAPRAKPTTQLKKKNWTKRDFMRLTWQQFEELTAELFSHIYNNATVALTPNRADQGVDVLITDNKHNEIHIVQCKRYRPDIKVSSLDMQKFAGAMQKFKPTKAYFVTSSSFNPYALNFADGIDGLELIESKQLLKMINNDGRMPSCQEFQNRN